MYVCMYACMHECMHVCMHVHVYINRLDTGYICLYSRKDRNVFSNRVNMVLEYGLFVLFMANKRSCSK